MISGNSGTPVSDVWFVLHGRQHCAGNRNQESRSQHGILDLVTKQSGLHVIVRDERRDLAEVDRFYCGLVAGRYLATVDHSVGFDRQETALGQVGPGRLFLCFQLIDGLDGIPKTLETTQGSNLAKC